MAKKLPDDLIAVRSEVPLTEEGFKRLGDAAFHRFRRPITAFITHARIRYGQCHGVVWGHDRSDVSGSLSDGNLIETSEVVAVVRDGDFYVIATQKSRYCLVSFDPNGGARTFRSLLLELGPWIPLETTIH